MNTQPLAAKVIGIGESDVLYFALPGDSPVLTMTSSSVGPETDLSELPGSSPGVHVRTIQFRFSDRQAELLPRASSAPR